MKAREQDDRSRPNRSRPKLLCAVCAAPPGRQVDEALDREFLVVRAADGDETLALLRAERPDLVVMVTGRCEDERLRICHAIRACAEGRETPIIVVASSAVPEEATHAFEAGADDYVAGPCHPSQLLAKAQTWLLRSARFRP
jgi:DNA-binding response OmpR family regulator